MINDSKNKKLIYYQSAIGFVMAACFIYGIKMLPMSEAVTLMYTSPVFSAGLSWYLLGDPFHRSLWIFIIISIVGVLLIMRPGVAFGEEIGDE